MIAYLLMGVALLLVFLVLTRLFVSANPQVLARALRWVGIVIAIGLGVLLLVRGQALIAGLFGGLAAALWRVRNLVPLLAWIWGVRRAAAARRAASAGPMPGAQSSAETVWLRMQLDHDSGSLDGEVLQGAFAGRRLSTLALGELLDLLRECSGDDRSRRLLEGFLDRTQPDWRDVAGTKGAPAGGETAMTAEEALDILGLSPGASDQDIKDAHRRLMKQVHPDHGGSDYLAAKINRAKDILLGEGG
jgi:hypothetical protein